MTALFTLTSTHPRYAGLLIALAVVVAGYMEVPA